MPRATLSFAALLLVAALAPEVHATCAYIPPSAMVIAKDPKNVQVPEGGGLLVAMQWQGPDDAKDKYYKLEQPTWRYRTGGKEYAPVYELLAPGLAIYRLPKGVTSAELVDGKKVLGKVTVVKDTTKPLPAPKLKKLRQESRSSRKGSTINMWAELAEKPPADAVALVVADDQGARSFGFAAVNDQNTALVYSHAPCGIDPDGQRMSSGGDKLTLYWIDRMGRVSAKTTATLDQKGSPIGPPVDD